jgi:hypothetical protein
MAQKNNSEKPGKDHSRTTGRKPGQGNSDEGVSRRLGADAASRGKKEVDKMHRGEGMGEQERTREGSQGGSKGQGGRN